MDRTLLHPARSWVLSHQDAHPLQPFILFVDTSASREPTAAMLDNGAGRLDMREGNAGVHPDVEAIAPPSVQSDATRPQVSLEIPSREHGSGDNNDGSASEDEGEDEDRRIVDPHEIPDRLFMEFIGMFSCSMVLIYTC